MKKTAFIMCLAIFTIGCESDDDAPLVDPTTVDADGDGINYTNELLANTDPNDPCSYKDSNLYYPATSQAWRNLDCDGDGVTNGMELDPDGNGEIEDNTTDPKWACDLIIANQTVIPSEQWQSGNCDGDLVSNGKEVIDGTNIFDRCDLIINNQDIFPNDGWFQLDCDEDGKSNEREINDNTDPFDPTDFDGAGSILKEIYQGTKLNYGKKYTFLNNGTLFDKVLDTNDNIISDFQYDSQDRLVSLIDYSNNYTINYNYNPNDEITQITINDDGDIYSYSLVYDGNIIYTYDGTELPGLFNTKYTFNNQNKLIERGVLNSNGDRIRIELYEYDENFENLTSSFEETLGYNQETGEPYVLEFCCQYSEVFQNYNYSQEDIENLFFDAYQTLSMNILLIPRPDKLLQQTFFENSGALSSKFVTSYSTHINTPEGVTLNFSIGYHGNFIQQNGLPTKIDWSTLNGSGSYEVHYE